MKGGFSQENVVMRETRGAFLLFNLYRKSEEIIGTNIPDPLLVMSRTGAQVFMSRA